MGLEEGGEAPEDDNIDIVEGKDDFHYFCAVGWKKQTYFYKIMEFCYSIQDL